MSDSVPRIVPIVHPLNQQSFRAVAATKQELRDAKTLIGVNCSSCQKKTENGMKCARCKIAVYCDKTCQRAHWKEHKPHCVSASPLVEMMPRLVNKLLSNQYLKNWLAVAFVCASDLDTNPSPNRPLLAFCKIVIQPCDPNNGLQLMVEKSGGSQTSNESVEGMLQFRSFEPRPSSSMHETQSNIWNGMKGQFSEYGGAGVHVGVVQLSFQEGGQSLSVGVPIAPEVIDLVKRGEPIGFTSAITGEKKQYALSPETCLRCMNLHIRDDKKNRLGLRMTLSRDVAKEEMDLNFFQSYMM